VLKNEDEDTSTKSLTIYFGIRKIQILMNAKFLQAFESLSFGLCEKFLNSPICEIIPL